VTPTTEPQHRNCPSLPWPLLMADDGDSPAKVAIITDAPDKATFEVQDEDHTLGNALRYMLIRK
jgi:hypothetical protein